MKFTQLVAFNPREKELWGKTENVADALLSTSNALVDLFATIGSLRSRGENEIAELFSKAFAEDKLLATKMAFYCRDIRGGLGERRTPRIIWRYMADNHNYIDALKENLRLIPFYGRWDDLLQLIDTQLGPVIYYIVMGQLDSDMEIITRGSGDISLLGKWMPSANTSSKKTRLLAKRWRTALGYDEETYRKMLSVLRKRIGVVERKMSAGEWIGIDYESVPSKAMMNYRQAFERHDPVFWTRYLEDVESGKKKVNAATLFPYEIFEKLGLDDDYESFVLRTPDRLVELQWESLPNYVGGGGNVLVIADTSGSMVGRPLCVSLSLAVYFAEKNIGDFANIFMTFSSQPSFVKLTGKTLAEKVKCIPAIVSNTNLEAAFQLVLDVAVAGNLEQEELPKSLLVITDGEFDRMSSDYGRMTYYDGMRNKFASAGYDIPNIVFWNVAARHNVYHATSDKKGVQLVSGSSPSIFKSVMDGLGKTPYEMMVDVLSSERYAPITVE